MSATDSATSPTPPLMRLDAMPCSLSSFLGTTLKAAKELGRRFVGIEINPEYVDICYRRLAQEVLNLS